METLGNILSVQAKNRGASIACVFDKQRLTYGDLNAQAETFAHRLKKLGFNKGDRVAILLHNSTDYLVGYFGIQKLGAVAVLLNTYLTAKELAYILNDCSPKVLLTSSDFNKIVPHLLQEVPSLREIIFSDTEPVPDTTFPAEELTREAINPQDLAVIIYTSGTSGNPRGVMLSHYNLISNVKSGLAAFDVNARDRVLCFLPMFHAYTFTVCVLLPLYAGARIYIVEKVTQFDKVIKSLLFDRITAFVAVPTIYNILAQKKIPPIAMRLLALRFCISGAAPLAESVLHKFEKKFRLALLEGYGLSEASPYVSCNPLTGVRKPMSVGGPLLGIKAKVVDDNGGDLSVNQVGELLVQGPNVMMGYFNRPEDTQYAIRDGWLYTGDMARIDEDGYIFIVDRKKDLIIYHGMNIYPREIEEALYRHPKILEAAVIGLPNECDGEYPVAYVVLKEGEQATEHEVRAFLKEQLACFKIPRQVCFWESLPKTPTGKVMKRMLKEKVLEELKNEERATV